MSLREKNGKWEYRFCISGERVTKLTSLAATDANRGRAQKLEQKLRDAIMRGESSPRRKLARRFINASEEFMAWCSIHHGEKPNTVKRISVSLWSLREWFGKQNVAAIRQSDIERYKTWRLKTHEVQPVTLRHDLDTLSKFFNWAVVMDMRNDNPVARVSKPSVEDAVRMHIVTPAEEFDYFTRCEQRGYRNLADVARLILDQGMRPDEVYSLERRGVDLTDGRVTIFAGKTKAARRRLKLTPECLQIVKRRYSQHEGSRWLFPSPKRSGRHLSKLNNSHDRICAAGEGREALRFVLYDLRHTAATRWAADGVDLPTIAAWLGHASLRLITRYIHVLQGHSDEQMDRYVARQHARPGVYTHVRNTEEQVQ